MLTIGAGEITWVKWGRKVTSEEFDQSAILLFLVGVVEHFAVVSGVVCPVLVSQGLVGAAEEGDFLGNEFPCGGGCEVAVVGWALAQLGLVADHCLRVFVSTEGFVNGRCWVWRGMCSIWCIHVVRGDVVGL